MRGVRTIATVDLLPPGVHQRRRRRARLRAYLVTFAVVFTGMGLFGLSASRRARQVDEFSRIAAGMSASEQRIRSQGAATLAELARTQKLLHEAERLRDGRRWSRLMIFLASEVPDTVRLVMVATDPPEPGQGNATRRSAKDRAAPRPEETVSPTALAIRGYAREHKDLAEFLNRLKERAVFDSVSLLHSKREPYLGGEGVAFTVTCHW